MGKKENDYNFLFKSALKSDVDDLFKQFNKGPLTYQHFLKCFKDVDFWTIFVGKITFMDAYEIFEEFFQHVASLIFPSALRKDKNRVTRGSSSISNEIGKEYEQAESLFGIYLCYTAYFLQPQNEVKLIRIHLEFMEYLPTVMDNLLAERQLHALFCLQRLLSSKAFNIIPFAEDYSPLIIHQKRQAFKENDMDIKYNDLERVKNVVESQDVQFASELHQKYVELKRKLEVPSLLNQVKDDVKRHVDDIVKEAEQKLKKDLTEKQSESILDRMSALRHRAFTSEIRLPSHRRHHEKDDDDEKEGQSVEEGDDEDKEAEPSSSKKRKGHDDDEEEGQSVEEDDDEDKEAELSSSKKRKGRKKVDTIQLRARMHLGLAKAKTNRMRQATIGEGDLSDSELLRREVETDVADAIAKDSKKLSPRKRAKSTATESSDLTTPVQDESPSASIGGRRRSQRLKSKGSAVVEEGILLPGSNQATGVTKEALKLLEKKRDTDQALERLKALKK
uniref:snRNA-activating protein complex subunit 1 n=1 Tax=Panagrolaimus sp. ES5 TaxID=591445 RepID=A0AC34FJX8_9BILA